MIMHEDESETVNISAVYLFKHMQLGVSFNLSGRKTGQKTLCHHRCTPHFPTAAYLKQDFIIFLFQSNILLEQAATLKFNNKLKSLHRLLVHFRTDFKMSFLVYRPYIVFPISLIGMWVLDQCNPLETSCF